MPLRLKVQGHKVVLRYFELVFGLRINLGKSTLIGIDVESTLTSLADELGCGVGRLPFIDLGLPIGGNTKSKRFWPPVVRKRKKD